MPGRGVVIEQLVQLQNTQLIIQCVVFLIDSESTLFMCVSIMTDDSKTRTTKITFLIAESMNSANKEKRVCMIYKSNFA